MSCEGLVKPCVSEIERMLDISRISDETEARGWSLFNERNTPTAEYFNLHFPRLFSKYPFKSIPRILRPYTQSDAPVGSLSSRVGLQAQPPHTDYAYLPDPPRYILLRCERPGEKQCPTIVWTLDWKSLVRDRPADLVRNGWLIQSSPQNRFYGTVVETEPDGMPTVRFDAFCMTPPLGAGSVGCATNCLQSYAASTVIEYSEGDCVLLDNWRVLHARGDGADEAPSRRLQRWTSAGKYIGV